MTNKALILLVLISSTTLAPALNAEEVRKTFKVEAFTDVEAGGHFEIDITTGETQEITLIADEKDLARVDVKVEEKSLLLNTKRDGLLWSQSPGSIKAIIKVPSLTAVDMSGAGKLDLKNLSSEEFELTISGAATARLSGNVKSFQVDISGSGKVRAFELQAESVEADVSGAGDVEVSASKIIDANVSGVGKLIYQGEPVKVMSKVSGVGNIRPRG